MNDSDVTRKMKTKPNVPRMYFDISTKDTESFTFFLTRNREQIKNGICIATDKADQITTRSNSDKSVRSAKYKTNTRIPIYNPECAVIIVGTCINLLFINLEKVGFSSTSTVSMPKRILCSVPYIA